MLIFHRTLRLSLSDQFWTGNFHHQDVGRKTRRSYQKGQHDFIHSCWATEKTLSARLSAISQEKGTRFAIWLVVSLFYFDCLPDYPNFYDIGYWGKRSIIFSAVLMPLKLSDNFKKLVDKFNKNSHFGKAWHFCRGPPDCRCFSPSTHRQLGGNYV